MGRGAGVAVSCGVVHRHSSDPTLLWLWYRPAATAPIRPLAWELPYAMCADGKRKKKKEEEKAKKKKENLKRQAPAAKARHIQDMEASRVNIGVRTTILKVKTEE